MTILPQAYIEWADEWEGILLDWMDPTQRYLQAPMKNYPLADFGSAFLTTIGYFVFVIFGSLIMKAGVPAINTSWMQFIYNPIQFMLCSYMCIEALIQAYRNGYTLCPCNEFNHANPVMGNVMYMFYLSKALDFFDTFFIIAGKKWRQLSILHVYHHSSVFFVYWALSRTSYDADLYLTIIMNGLVHTIMYMYYFVSAHTRTIWWKKYLTRIQIIQFGLMNTQGYLMWKGDCDGTPKKVPWLYLIYVQSIFWFFLNFYIRSYVVKKTPENKKQE